MAQLFQLGPIPTELYVNYGIQAYWLLYLAYHAADWGLQNEMVRGVLWCAKSQDSSWPRNLRRIVLDNLSSGLVIPPTLSCPTFPERSHLLHPLWKSNWAHSAEVWSPSLPPAPTHPERSTPTLFHPPQPPFGGPLPISTTRPKEPFKDQSPSPLLAPKHPLEDQSQSPPLAPKHPLEDQSHSPLLVPKHPLEDQSQSPPLVPKHPFEDQSQTPPLGPNKPLEDHSQIPLLTPNNPSEDQIGSMTELY